MNNYLKLSDCSIKFFGFDRISDIATFCFYDNGIVVTGNPDLKENDYHRKFHLNNDRTIVDEKLVKKIRTEYNYEDIVSFVNINNDYLEVNLHKRNIGISNNNEIVK